MSDPEMMRAVVLTKRGTTPDDLTVRPWPRPVAGPGEVLVRVRTVTAASIDVQACERPLTELPRILGQDPAGVVVEVGAGVRRVRVGERVTVSGFQACGSCHACREERPFCERHEVVGMQRDGGRAEYVAVPEEVVVAIPDGVGFAEASIMAITYPIAWNLVAVNGRVGPGDQVLVMAAAGGVGMACVQVARALGAQVVAAVGAEWKAERLRKLLGIEAVVDYSAPDWPRSVSRIAGPRGIDVVVENVSDPVLFDGAMRTLAMGGRLVTCGAHGGGTVTVDIRSLYLRRQSIIGVNMPGRDVVAEVWDLVERRRLPLPPLDREFALEELPDVHRLIASRRSVGRTLIRVAADDS